MRVLVKGIYSQGLVKLLFRFGQGYRIALYCTAFTAIFVTRYALVESILSIVPRKVLTL